LRLILPSLLLLGAGLLLWRGGGRLRDWQRASRRGHALEARAQRFLEDPRTDRWVTIAEPDACFNGYTLVLVMRRIPALIDMNGAVHHVWPRVRCKSRARLLPNGDLIALCSDGAVRRYDWEGRLLWSFVPPQAGVRTFLHHDLQPLDNGDCLLLCRDIDSGLDSILQVDSEGREVWRWSIGDHLDDDLYSRTEVHGDWTHLNSLQILPPNPHFDHGDPRFAPGNILVSARNLNTIFIIDKESGEPVWRYSERLDRQHEALMIASGCPGAGNILLFNNGRENRYRERESVILEIEPLTRQVLCRYRVPFFYTVEGGVQQPLPNGNILITSSHGGRVFEIDPSAEIVWQWTPPFFPMRPIRYGPTDCRRFASLPPVEPPLPRREQAPFIDRDLFLFAPWAEAIERRRIAGRERALLRAGGHCETLLLPPTASLDLSFGLDPAALAHLPCDSLQVTFRAHLRRADAPPRELLVVSLTLPTRAPTWQEQRLSLDGYAYEEVTLCLEAVSTPPLAPEQLAAVALWGRPRIRQGETDAAALSPRALTPEERREWQAFGYTD
jgi:hypothetical protein